MIDKNSEQYKQFDNLWNGVTPKGNNISKKNSFRSKMKNSCQQGGLEFCKVNSFRIFTGETRKSSSETYRVGDVKVTKPPRRHLRGI